MMDREKRNKQVAFAISLGLHGVLFLCLFFLAAWRAPNPPLPEYGIELNFGLDAQGSGEEQPTEVANPAETQPEPQPAETITEQTTPAQQETPVVAAQPEGDVSIKEEPKKKVPEPVRKPVAEPVKSESRNKEEPQPERPAESKPGHPGKQGDDQNQVGDKGNPEGSLDARALYGKQGGGGGGDGMVLQMSGWAWADKPEIPDLPDNQDGRIVFEIECDDQGEILTINTVERGLSPQAERILKDQIRRNSLIRTSAGITPERSKGRVVFVLKTK